MATFSVILEDAVRRSAGGKEVPEFVNRRVDIIDATDLDDAWLIARTKYYLRKIAGPDTQIVDIKEGAIPVEVPPAEA